MSEPTISDLNAAYAALEQLRVVRATVPPIPRDAAKEGK